MDHQQMAVTLSKTNRFSRFFHHPNYVAALPMES